MAHTCPECGETCYCGGDIDDILWSEDSEQSDNCEHVTVCNNHDCNDDCVEE